MSKNKIGFALLAILLITGVTIGIAQQLKTNSADTAKSDANLVGGNSGFNAIFANWAEDAILCPAGNCYNEKDIINVSFYLPVDSHTFVTGSGNLGGGPPVSIGIRMDNSTPGDIVGKFTSNGSGFSISTVYNLQAGFHTAHLFGTTLVRVGVPEVSISVVAAQKGAINRLS